MARSRTGLRCSALAALVPRVSFLLRELRRGSFNGGARNGANADNRPRGQTEAPRQTDDTGRFLRVCTHRLCVVAHSSTPLCLLPVVRRGPGGRPKSSTLAIAPIPDRAHSPARRSSNAHDDGTLGAADTAALLTSSCRLHGAHTLSHSLLGSSHSPSDSRNRLSPVVVTAPEPCPPSRTRPPLRRHVDGGRAQQDRQSLPPRRQCQRQHSRSPANGSRSAADLDCTLLIICDHRRRSRGRSSSRRKDP